MILIDRGPPPEFFASEHCASMEEELWSHFADYGVAERRSSYDFESLRLLRKVILDEVLERFHGKCAFCESDLTAGARPELDHFRPKRGARGLTAKGTTFHDLHYWWLALRWDNLLLLCPDCNHAKATWFPLVDEPRRASIPTTREEAAEATSGEEPLLLDPCGRRQPAEHLKFDGQGRVKALTQEGKATIDILKLNRRGLVVARRRALRQLRKAYERAAADPQMVHDSWIEELAEVLDTRNVSRRPYLGIQRQFLEEWLADNDELGGRVLGAVYPEEIPEDAYEQLSKAAPEPEAGAIPLETLDLGRIVIRRIVLHNFKNIADMTIDVPPKSGSQSPWMVFLGENAMGKSTIMQAIVLTLMGDQHRSEIPGLDAEEFLRYYWENGELKRSREGFVEIRVEDSETPLRLTFAAGDPLFHSNVAAPRTYLLAYGPTRLLPEPDQEPYESAGQVRVRNLFRPSTPLIDAREWLFALYEREPERFDMMVRGLRDMLVMKPGETIEPDLEDPDGRRILVRFKKETTAITSLSDGYRSIVALASDLMFMLSREGTSMTEAEGVVLIDEIGTNLHPGWKKRIVGCFRKVFPRIQFIASTHEPLCLRGLEQGETILLRRDLDDNIVPVTNLPNPNDLRIDELLTSEFFGLSSTLESDLEEIYEEYYALLRLEELDSEQKKLKAKLKTELRERQHLGTGLRDELMYEVIDKLLAEQLRSPQPMDRGALKKETLQRVLDSWKEAGLLGEDAAGA